MQPFLKVFVMEVIKLRNGSEEPEPIVKVTMMALESLESKGLPGMLALYDLAEICKGKTVAPYGDNQKMLQDLALLKPDGQPHESIRNVVLSAVQGEGLGMYLGSPVASESGAVDGMNAMADLLARIKTEGQKYENWSARDEQIQKSSTPPVGGRSSGRDNKGRG